MRKPCVLCGENTAESDLNEYGECVECVDAANAQWGF